MKANESVVNANERFVKATRNACLTSPCNVFFPLSAFTSGCASCGDRDEPWMCLECHHVGCSRCATDDFHVTWMLVRLLCLDSNVFVFIFVFAQPVFTSFCIPPLSTLSLSICLQLCQGPPEGALQGQLCRVVRQGRPLPRAVLCRSLLLLLQVQRVCEAPGEWRECITRMTRRCAEKSISRGLRKIIEVEVLFLAVPALSRSSSFTLPFFFVFNHFHFSLSSSLSRHSPSSCSLFHHSASLILQFSRFLCSFHSTLQALNKVFELAHKEKFGEPPVVRAFHVYISGVLSCIALPLDSVHTIVSTPLAICVKFLTPFSSTSSPIPRFSKPSSPFSPPLPPSLLSLFSPFVSRDQRGLLGRGRLERRRLLRRRRRDQRPECHGHAGQDAAREVR